MLLWFWCSEATNEGVRTTNLAQLLGQSPESQFPVWTQYPGTLGLDHRPPNTYCGALSLILHCHSGWENMICHIQTSCRRNVTLRDSNLKLKPSYMGHMMLHSKMPRTFKSMVISLWRPSFLWLQPSFQLSALGLSTCTDTNVDSAAYCSLTFRAQLDLFSPEASARSGTED